MRMLNFALSKYISGMCVCDSEKDGKEKVGELRRQ